MKNLLKYPIFALLAMFALASCDEDETVNAMVETFDIENFDAIQVTNAAPYVEVSIGGSGDGIKSVSANIKKQGTSDVVANASLNNIVVNSISRTKLRIPFPDPSVAPTGLYTITYSVDAGNGLETKSFDVNILNNQVIKVCDFSDVELPAGESVLLLLTVPEGIPDGDKIYATGSFEGALGGGDWSGGGNPDFELTKLSDQCYYLAFSPPAGAKFKITRGAWANEFTDENGVVMNDIEYTGGSEIGVTAYNWKDLPTVVATVAEEFPSDIIQQGKLTIIAELGSDLSKDSVYHFVPKGATDLSGAVKATPLTESNSVGAAMPKTAGAEYVLIRGDKIDAVGGTATGFTAIATWDGVSNPIYTNRTIQTFEKATVVIVGGATPAGWGADASSNQELTKVGDGKWEITTVLTTGEKYIFLPFYQDWDNKWAFGSGTPLEGGFDRQGSGVDIDAPATTGTYKIEVDFGEGDHGTYKLTLQ